MNLMLSGPPVGFISVENIPPLLPTPNKSCAYLTILPGSKEAKIPLNSCGSHTRVCELLAASPLEAFN